MALDPDDLRSQSAKKCEVCSGSMPGQVKQQKIGEWQRRHGYLSANAILLVETSPLNWKHERIRHDTGIHHAEPVSEPELVSLANNDIGGAPAGDQLALGSSPSASKSANAARAVNAFPIESRRTKSKRTPLMIRRCNLRRCITVFCSANGAVAQHRLALAQNETKFHAALQISFSSGFDKGANRRQ